MATIRIDNAEICVDPEKNVLEAALQAGLDLPYFCWHPALGSVGACRQCAVTQYQDDNDQRGRVVMSCMTPCSDGARFSIEDAAAAEMRQAVIEFLMTNHPHDCPVCEEGGNCHLQDMTVMTGQVYRRYRHRKRSHRNQDLGPLVSHEMNRCIACYRCVRYYRDYAGGGDLNVFGAHNDVYFGREADGTLESPFAGNLVEVCPTGVFTDKPYGDSYTRKWDLQQAPSVCTHCSVGCNTLPGERYGTIKRVENRYNGAVNGYFLCDRGRYGHGYSRAGDRPAEIRLAGTATDAETALERLAGWLEAGGVAAVGSPRAALETSFALRELVGAENFHRGQSTAAAALDDAALTLLSSRSVDAASLPDIERADAALVLGEDLLDTAPRIALALRQMTRNRSFDLARAAHVPVWQEQSVRLVAQDQRSPLHLVTPSASDLDAVAARRLRADGTRIARLGHAVAQALDPALPAVAGLEAEEQALAAAIAEDLAAAARPLLVTGTGAGSQSVLVAAQAIANALHARSGTPLKLVCVLSAANTLGTALLGGEAASALLERADLRTLIVAETDLSRVLPPAQAEALLARVENLVVLDCIDTPTTRRADLLLPAGDVFESDGTLVSCEGRAQRYFQVHSPDGVRCESWRWLQRLAARRDRPLGDTLDALTAACARSVPALAGIVDAAPAADFRIAGRRVPRQSHRYSGRTAMNASRDIHEPQPPRDADSALAFSMEGGTTAPQPPADPAPGQQQAASGAPAALLPIFWAPRWNSIQSVNKFQDEIGGALRGGDPGVRLLDGSDGDGLEVAAPPAATAELVAVPHHSLFAGEELAARSAPLRERAGTVAELLLHPDQAAALGLDEGAQVSLALGEERLSLRLSLSAGIAPGCAGLPGHRPLPWGAAVTVGRAP